MHRTHYIDRIVLRVTALALFAGLVAAAPAYAQEALPLGSAMPMPDHNFARVDGGQANLAGMAGSQGTVVIFWSNNCPWVKNYGDRVAGLVNEHAGFNFVLVNANDAAAFPQESTEESARRLESLRGSVDRPDGLFYVVDEGSALAHALGAERTPHVFVFDSANALIYVGAIDDSPGDAGAVQKRYLSEALAEAAAGGAITTPKTKAFGCMIRFQQ